MLFKVEQSPCSGSLLGGGGHWGFRCCGDGHLFVQYFGEELTILLDEVVSVASRSIEGISK